MKEKFSFLSSTRFWALVIIGLGIAVDGNFTQEAWIKGAIAVLGGFIGVKTIDRGTETLAVGCASN